MQNVAVDPCYPSPTPPTY